MGNFGAAHFAGDDDAIGGHQRLRGDADLIGVYAGLLAFAIVKIDDFVGNAIRDLVGMTFGNRFAREQIIAAGHELLSKFKTHCRTDVGPALPGQLRIQAIGQKSVASDGAR